MTQDTELFELCKQVYDKTDWIGKGMDAIRDDGAVFVGETHLIGDYGFTALYTSDYLLEKLPKESEELGYLDLCSDGGNWMARYTRLSATNVYNKAATPLRALLKLTLALHEAGELHD